MPSPISCALRARAAHAIGLAGLLVASALGCTETAQPGTAERPLRLLLFPSSTGPPPQEARDALASFVLRRSGLVLGTRVPVDSFDAVQQLGRGEIDLALLNDLSFLLAEDTFRARARLRVLREGRAEHRAQILVRADDAMASPVAVHGKRVAYVDPYSMTGFVLVAHLLRQQGAAPGATSFVGSHVEAVRQVLQGDADAAATYVDEGAGPGLPRDLQRALQPRFPDAAGSLRALATTAAVPNEPVAFARHLDEALVRRLVETLLAAASDPAAAEALRALGNVGGFTEASGEDYTPLRQMLDSLGKNIDDGVPGGWKLKLRANDRVR